MLGCAMSSKNNNKFDYALRVAIDQALNVIGEPAKKILYYHLENKFCLKPQVYAENPELFILATRKLLGVGAEIIEVQILKNLCRECKVNLEEIKGLKIEEAIEKIKQKGSGYLC
jgi:hypothetical protein